MHLIEALHWRYATKRMTGETLPKHKVETVLEAVRLAPTSSGIQPFTILHITDKQLLEKIKPIANNQAQITEASDLLVFAAWEDVTPQHIDAVYDRISRERNLAPGAQKEYVEKLKTRFAGSTPEFRAQWAIRQAYLALGIAITAAALEKVDASPMEGFRNAELDQLLGLPEKGLRSYALLALGVRDPAADKLVHLKKVRRPKEELIINL
ncbi:MAG TPA: nitroreductase family protein [Puia sp.]|uniref:nitroreductase family protein n=1 Tax=Puia sp. TaxID=2045100 RepID=UPI002BD920D4|nr:nitroreductase family protein [Puia sp.]HVU94551.1 nitroreductase family protein [Puia sp.]